MAERPTDEGWKELEKWVSQHMDKLAFVKCIHEVMGLIKRKRKFSTHTSFWQSTPIIDDVVELGSENDGAS